MPNEWFKVYSKGWLTGSIRAQLTPAERSVWADLLAMASESRVRGVICRARGIPYTREYIASFLEIPIELLNSTIEKCSKDENADDPTTRIMFDGSGCIIIANWEKYQSKPTKPEKDSPHRSDEELDAMSVRRHVKKPHLITKSATLVNGAFIDSSGEIKQDQSVLNKKAAVIEQVKAVESLQEKAKGNGGHPD